MYPKNWDQLKVGQEFVEDAKTLKRIEMQFNQAVCQ